MANPRRKNRQHPRQTPVGSKPKLDPGTQKERELRATLATLEHELNQTLASIDPDYRALVKRFIHAMAELTDIADPIRSSPIEAQVTYRHPDSTTDEGRDTRWARTLMNRFRREVSSLLNEYEARIQGTYKPAQPTPKVRCRNRSCPNEGKRIPQYIGPGNTIELVQCPSCLGQLTQA